MIKSFKHKGLERFFREGSKAGIQPKHERRLRLQLGRLDAARSAVDMELPGWRWHALKGELKGHWAVFVEKNRDAFKLIQRNLSMCHMEDRSEVLLKDVDQAVRMFKRKGDCFDLILMDPPYEKGLIEKTLKRLDTETIYHDDSILVVEHNRREPLPDSSGGWNLISQRRTGDTLISILIPIL